MEKAIENPKKISNYFHSQNDLVNFVDVVTNMKRHDSLRPELPQDALKYLATQGVCKLNVNAIECEYPDARPRKEKDMHKQERALSPLALIAEQRKWTDEEIRYGAQVLLNHQIFIGGLLQERGIQIFEGNKKGFARYNKKAEAKIKDACAELENGNYDCFFVTTTLDPEAVDHNRFVAWKIYTREISKIFKKEVKHGGVKVLWVIESTKDGYPHIHMIVAYPKGTYRGYDKLPINKSIKFGVIVEKLKNNPLYRIFDVKKPKDDGIKFYLSKYLAKSENLDVPSIAKGNGELSADERKYMQGLLYTTIARRRSFGLPRVNGNKKKKKADNHGATAPKEQSEQEVETIEDAEQVFYSGEKLGRLRPFLRRLCTNFPCLNAKRIVSANFLTANRLLNGKLEKKEPLTDEEKQNFFKNAIPLTCGGCYFVHLANLILSGDDELLNITVGEKDGKPIKFITPEIFANDDLFIQNLIVLIQVSTSFICDTNGTLTTHWTNKQCREMYFNERRLVKFPEEDNYNGEFNYLRARFEKIIQNP